MKSKANVLVVDDDANMQIAIRESLLKAGYAVSTAEDGRKAIKEMEKKSVDVVITDIQMPNLNGMELLRYIKKQTPYLPVILVTGYATVQDAVSVIKEGAFDYIQKPFDRDTLCRTVFRALGEGNGDIVCESKAMKDVFAQALLIAESDESVFLMGESGVGKEVVAKYIHKNSPRAGKQFVGINCASLPENLMESELFGYEKGAFTGANYRKPGKFEVADKGTILLDEITEMDMRLQSKLLRVLQEKEIEVLGAKTARKVDVRVIATTNRNLQEYVREGKFRQDLYYRLNVLPIYIPPLRERKEDIPMLAACFLRKYSKGMDAQIEEEVMECLYKNPWHGNVRELENVIARACVLSNYGIIKKHHIEEMSQSLQIPNNSIRDVEAKTIIDALKSSGGNRTKAAKLLGITTRTIRNKIHGYREIGIDIPDWRFQ